MSYNGTRRDRPSERGDSRNRSYSPIERRYKGENRFTKKNSEDRLREEREDQARRYTDNQRRPSGSFSKDQDWERNSRSLATHAKNYDQNADSRRESRDDAVRPQKDAILPRLDKSDSSSRHGTGTMNSSNTPQADFVTLLEEFGNSVARKVALQFRTDSAEATLQRRISEIEDFRPYQNDYSSSVTNAQMLSKAKAVKDLEMLNKKLQAPDANLKKTIKALAEAFSDHQRPSARDFNDLRQNFKDLESQSEGQFSTLQKTWQNDLDTLKTHIHDISSQIRSNAESIILLGNDMSKLKAESTQLNANGIASQLATGEKIDDLATQVEALAKKMDEIPTNSNLESQKTSADLRSLQMVCGERHGQFDQLRQYVMGDGSGQQSIREMLSDLNDRSTSDEALLRSLRDDSESIRGKYEVLYEKFATQVILSPAEATFSRVAPDVVNTLQHRVAKLEKQLDDTLKSTQAIELVTKSHRQAIEAAKAAQEQGDNLFGDMLDGLTKRCETNEVSVQHLRAAHGGENDAIKSRMHALEATTESIKTYMRDFKINHTPTVAINTRPAPVADVSGYTAMASKLHSLDQQLEAKMMTLKQTLMSDFRDETDSLQMGVRSLDARFNNLSTEYLAKHILGHMQGFYPHVAKLEATLDSLATNANLVQGHARLLEERVQALEGSPIIKGLEDRIRTFESDLASSKTDAHVVREALNLYIPKLEHHNSQIEGLTTQVTQMHGTAAQVQPLLDHVEILENRLGRTNNMFEIRLLTTEENVKTLVERVTNFESNSATSENCANSSTVPVTDELTRTKERVDMMEANYKTAKNIFIVAEAHTTMLEALDGRLKAIEAVAASVTADMDRAVTAYVETMSSKQPVETRKVDTKQPNADSVADTTRADELASLGGHLLVLENVNNATTTAISSDIQSFQDRVKSLEARFDIFKKDVIGNAQSELKLLGDRVGSFAEHTQALNEQVAILRKDVNTLETERNTSREADGVSKEAVLAELHALEKSVSDLTSAAENRAQVLQELGTKFEEHEKDFGEHQVDVAERIGYMLADLDTFQSQIKDLDSSIDNVRKATTVKASQLIRSASATSTNVKSPSKRKDSSNSSIFGGPLPKRRRLPETEAHEDSE